MCFSCFRPAPPSPVPQKRDIPQPQPMAKAESRTIETHQQEMEPLSVPPVQTPQSVATPEPILEDTKQTQPAADHSQPDSQARAAENTPDMAPQDMAPAPPAAQPLSLSEQLAQLRDAVNRGDVEGVQQAVALWSTCEADGSCAAHWAVSSGQVHVLRAMLASDSATSAFLVKNMQGRLPIHLCLDQSPSANLDVLSALFNHKPVCQQSAKFITDSGDSVATLAFKHDEPGALKLLLNAITDLDSARFLLLEHQVDDRSLVDASIAATESKPHHARIVVTAAHALQLLDVSECNAKAIQRDDMPGLQLILSIDPVAAICSSNLLSAICNSPSKRVVEFLTAVKDVVVANNLDITKTVAASLEDAVGRGLVPVAEALLAFPGAHDACRIDDLTADGTLLHHAVVLNKFQMAKLLLPASTSVANKEGCHPLHLAVMSGNVQMVDLLLEQFKNVDQVGPDGQTAMHFAILHAPALVIPRLAACGASPNITDANGRSPLHYANRAKYPESVHALVLAGARGDVPTPDGLTPLLTALAPEPVGPPSVKSMLTPLQLVAQLLNAPATDIFAQDPRTGNTALHLAVKQGNAPVARYMLESSSPTSPGAVASAQWSMAKDGGLPQVFRSPWQVLNHDGHSPAHLAVISEHKLNLTFQLLSLCEGHGLNVVDSRGKTVLDLIVDKGETLAPLVESIRELGGRRASDVPTPSDLSTAASAIKDESSAPSTSSAAIMPQPDTSIDDPIAAYMFSKTTSQDPSPAATPFSQSVTVPSEANNSSGPSGGSHVPILEEREELPMLEIDDPIAAYLSGSATSAAQPANSLPGSAAASQRVNVIAEASQGLFASLATSQPPILEHAEPSSHAQPSQILEVESRTRPHAPETPISDTKDEAATSVQASDPPQVDGPSSQQTASAILNDPSSDGQIKASDQQGQQKLPTTGAEPNTALIPISPSFNGTIITANGTPFASLPRTAELPEPPRIVPNQHESSELEALFSKTATNAPRSLVSKGSQKVSQSMDVFSSGDPTESATALAVPSASSHKAPSVDALARDDSVQPPLLADLVGPHVADRETDTGDGGHDNQEHDLDEKLADDLVAEGTDLDDPSSLVLPSDIGNDTADVDDEEIRALAEEFGVAELFDPATDGEDNEQDEPLKSAQGSMEGEARDGGDFASAEDLANDAIGNQSAAFEDTESNMPFRSAGASAVDDMSASQTELADKLRSLELEEEAMLREVAGSGKSAGKPVAAYELSLSELDAMGTATDMSGFDGTNSTDLLARLAQEEEQLMAQIRDDSQKLDDDPPTRSRGGSNAAANRKRTATGATTTSLATSAGQRSRVASGMGM